MLEGGKLVALLSSMHGLKRSQERYPSLPCDTARAAWMYDGCQIHTVDASPAGSQPCEMQRHPSKPSSGLCCSKEGVGQAAEKDDESERRKRKDRKPSATVS